MAVIHFVAAETYADTTATTSSTTSATFRFYFIYLLSRDYSRLGQSLKEEHLGSLVLDVLRD